MIGASEPQRYARRERTYLIRQTRRVRALIVSRNA
jgi:hypothetical protein